jgi:hypothetical protein
MSQVEQSRSAPFVLEEHHMKNSPIRVAVAAAGTTLATAAQAAETTYAGMSVAAWGSILAVVGVVLALVWVYKKTN